MRAQINRNKLFQQVKRVVKETTKAKRQRVELGRGSVCKVLAFMHVYLACTKPWVLQ